MPGDVELSLDDAYAGLRRHARGSQGLDAQAFALLKDKLWAFMHAEIYPNEQLFHEQVTDTPARPTTPHIRSRVSHCPVTHRPL